MSFTPLTPLEKFWIENEKIWFNADDRDDQEVCDIFKGALGPLKDYNPQSLTDIILRWDQIERHICRVEKRVFKFNYNLVKLVKLCLDTQTHPVLQTFCLLVWRHSKILFLVEYARDVILDYMFKFGSNPHYIRFYIATVKQLSIMSSPSLNTENVTYDSVKCVIDNDHYISTKNDSPLFQTQKKCIVSLSGGVDSVVVLHHLWKSGLCVGAVHINYKNSPKADREADFCKYICNKFGIPLYIREITEIHRIHGDSPANVLRDFYEKITEEIRYNAYKFVVNKFNEKIYIAFGHNKNDVYENVITNLLNGRVQHLHGMFEESVKFGVNIFRPLLEITKEEIHSYATHFELSHTKNSTPSWSRRGQIRDNIVDMLKRPCFGTQLNCMDALHRLSTKIDDMSDMAHAYIDSLNVRNEENKLSFVTVIISETFLKLFFEKYRISVSQKCLLYIIERVKNMKSQSVVLKARLNKTQNISITKRKNDFCVVIEL
jgi:tRNA(Ile)-lysidine synthetase-like protein